MTDHALTAELRAALAALITEARAKGPGRIMTVAERKAVLWTTDREEGPPTDWADHFMWLEDPRRRVQ